LKHLTYLRGLEITELKEEEMTIVYNKKPQYN